MNTDDQSHYTIVWPHDLLRSELSRLLERAPSAGRTDEWRDEVEVLLRQAFLGPFPAEEFLAVPDPPLAGQPPAYDMHEEPF